jgi:predicted secreted Zn-dependent protease
VKTIGEIRVDVSLATSVADAAVRKLAAVAVDLDRYQEYLDLVESQNFDLRMENEALIEELHSQEQAMAQAGVTTW